MKRFHLLSVISAVVFFFMLILIPLTSGEAQTSAWTPAWVNLSDTGGLHTFSMEDGAETPKADIPISATPPQPTEPSDGLLGGISRFFSSIFNTAPAPSVVSAGWADIFSDDFEGSFPGAWTVFDNDGSTNGTYYWGQRDCRPYTGNYSAWAVGGGVSGSTLLCNNNYPNNAKSWMVYGPFSLEDATNAEFEFMFWLNSEIGYDFLYVGASIDGLSFYGEGASGIFDWSEHIFSLTDVPVIGNLTGKPQVWVLLLFQSDLSNTYAEGVYVDDIVLRKYVEGDFTVTPTATSTATSLATSTATPTATATSLATSTATATPTATTTVVIPLTATPTMTQTPVTGNLPVYLPMVMNNQYNGPTPTPTKPLPPTTTPTPTMTLPATITPTPTATSDAVVPNDGNWSGLTSQGRTITMVVVSNGTEVDTTKLTVFWNGACGVTSTTYYFYDAAISNGSFYESQYEGTYVRGTFTSETSASGNFYAVEEYLGCRATVSGTWTANFVP